MAIDKDMPRVGADEAERAEKIRKHRAAAAARENARKAKAATPAVESSYLAGFIEDEADFFRVVNFGPEVAARRTVDRQPAAGTKPPPERSDVAVDLARLLPVAAIGIALGYLLSPISPIAWAHTWGLLAVCALPLFGLAIALIKTARS